MAPYDHRNRSQAGVTLIELLVTISLLSVLSLGLLFAMRIGLNTMERVNAKVNTNRRVLGVDKVLSLQIASFMPAKLDCRGPEGAPTAVSLFQGDQGTMRFLSSYSLNDAARGYPQLLEFQVIPGADGRGVRLIVNERAYAGPATVPGLCFGFTNDPVNGFPVGRYQPVETGPSSFVLADRLAYCRFFYREDLLPPASGERWVERWGRYRWPSAIRVEIAPLEPDASKLQLSSFTELIRVSKDPFHQYGN